MVTLQVRGMLLVVAIALAGCTKPVDSAPKPALTIAVMDPLAAHLSCTCVKGYAQRHYEALGQFLTRHLDRPIKVVFGEDLGRLVQDPESGTVALVIGKTSVVQFDAAKLQLPLRPLALLSDREGKTTLCGLFVVPGDDAARQLADLKGYQVVLGPTEAREKRAAALEALIEAGVPIGAPLTTAPACSDAALRVLENSGSAKMAAVISSYARPILEGCGTVEKGALRVVGQTAEVPFIAVFATDRCPPELDAAFRTALLAVKNDAELLAALESRDGFVPSAAAGPAK